MMTQKTHDRPGKVSSEFVNEIVQMINARRELAELELTSDIESARGLATGGGIGAVLALTGLPVLAVLGANYAATCSNGDANLWMLGVGLSCLIIGGLTGLFSWLRFRKNLVGFRATLEELREDVTWLQEWTGTPDDRRDATEESA